MITWQEEDEIVFEGPHTVKNNGKRGRKYNPLGPHIVTTEAGWGRDYSLPRSSHCDNMAGRG